MQESIKVFFFFMVTLNPKLFAATLEPCVEHTVPTTMKRGQDRRSHLEQSHPSKEILTLHHREASVPKDGSMDRNGLMLNSLPC